MSKPSALPSPRDAAPAAPAPTAPPAGPERTLQAPGPRRLRGRRDAAGGLHHQRLRQPGVRGGLAEPAEVAAEQGGEVGVDHGGRAALVLAEPRQHLVRGGDVDAGQRARAGARRAARSWRGVEVGEEQADRDRLGAAVARAARRAARARPRRAARPRPSGPIRSAASKRSSGVDQRRRLRRAEAVEARGGPGGRSRAGRRSPRSRPGRCGRRAPRAGRWCPTVIPWAKASTVAGARRRPGPAPRRPRPSPPPTGRSGVVGTLAVWTRSPSNRTASVKVPPTSTPSSMGRRYRTAQCPALLADLAVGACQARGGRRRARWCVGRSSGQSVPQVAAARLAALQRAGGDRPRRAGRGRAISSRQLLGAARRPGQAPDRLAGLLGRAARSASREAPAAPPAALAERPRAAARAPKTKHSLSEFEASRLAPCRPVQEHSPTA